MSDFDLLKGMRTWFFAKLLVQVLIGVAFTLVLASFIKPVDITDSYPDPFFIQYIVEHVYNSMILACTESAKLIVPIALLYGISTMGYIGMKAIEFVGERLLVLSQIIEKKIEEDLKE